MLGSSPDVTRSLWMGNLNPERVVLLSTTVAAVAIAVAVAVVEVVALIITLALAVSIDQSPLVVHALMLAGADRPTK